MLTKAGLLLALALVFLGYRWGRRKTLERMERNAPTRVIPATPPRPKTDWLSVKVLLGIVIVLLIIAILSSLGGRIG